ncbi:bifunctional adenosylcobinamide kinase/adenosylcobinamide-phosphate guanylyltransferase [Neobacillus cucumis]|uniref:bifunctional adenosylcobinamide kinase/adenosylcobinamide-phosphate guanylyltransferase n=1 Tax=Neobacillus cucumis TaxID=1740721 RepID=UPI0018E036F7|nr:bifunctional adenosylcobinamide kinase/adenosylcobinamide-phosphate guanylyltransferase [Neobacillus cucumis]MBI0577089.1 bifunctional adenosylcobinamide kinase/adenosylcobinamide-phosphate guanylyltransferase [Neobacillus cucumis]
MHFITGGAFNGKREWVRETYKVQFKAQWTSAYQKDPFPFELDEPGTLLILEGIEMWINDLMKEYEPNKCREIWKNCLTHWISWEKAERNRNLVVIGTDITKGIVPLEKENRLWRDLTGWAYQDIAAAADRVDVIWYGLNQTIKGGGM